jgi:hypothetical protein
MKLRVGDAVRATGESKPNRPGVILRVWTVGDTDYVYVAFGSTKEAQGGRGDPVVVRRGQLGFIDLGLDEETWFKVTFGGRLKASDPSIVVVGRCPDSLLIRIRELFGFK